MLVSRRGYVIFDFGPVTSLCCSYRCNYRLNLQSSWRMIQSTDVRFKHKMKGIVSSEEESVRETLFGFDEAMEVNCNADMLHCALFWSIIKVFKLTNFCLSLSSNSLMSDNLLIILQIIWKHQNPPDCSKAKFLIVSPFNSGMWLDDDNCMFISQLRDFCTLVVYLLSRCIDLFCNVTAVESQFDWFLSQLKDNPYYDHGWLILHFVLHFTTISIHPNTTKEVNRSHQFVPFSI